MSWSDLEAALDNAIFDRLSDDPAAIWSRGADFATAVRVMLDQVEQTDVIGGLPTLQRADVVRLSVAEVEAKRPGQRPEAGDVFTVNGVAWVAHGTAYLDRMAGGRDWLCPVMK